MWFFKLCPSRFNMASSGCDLRGSSRRAGVTLQGAVLLDRNPTKRRERLLRAGQRGEHGQGCTVKIRGESSGRRRRRIQVLSMLYAPARLHLQRLRRGGGACPACTVWVTPLTAGRQGLASLATAAKGSRSWMLGRFRASDSELIGASTRYWRQRSLGSRRSQ